MKSAVKPIVLVILSLFIFDFAQAQIVSYEALNKEIGTLKTKLVPDKRVAIFTAELIDTLQKMPVLKGKTDLPEAKQQLKDFETDVIKVEMQQFLKDQSDANED